MLGILGPEQIERLLQQECIGRIGCHADGATYVVPITYRYDGKSVYGHSTEGQKLRMMRANPEVCFEVDRMHDMGNWESVVAHGRFKELDAEETAAAMEAFVRWLRPRNVSETAQPEHHGAGATAIAFRIDLDRKTGRFEKR